jgi:GT2 family glycosyltransferase
MLVARSWFDRVSGFDPRFFMYSEEADLHLRMSQAGGAVAVALRACVLHEKETGSAGVSARWRTVERLVGHTLFMHKHYGLLGGAADVLRSLRLVLFARAYRPRRVSLVQYSRGIWLGARRRVASGG